MASINIDVNEWTEDFTSDLLQNTNASSKDKTSHLKTKEHENYVKK